MLIDLNRKWRKAGYTIGLLSIDGKLICNTLEDTDRGLTKDMSKEDIAKAKVYGKTAIPTGTYKVVMTYSNHFKKNMPLLVDVPGYEGVRIHAGNTPEDTLGCILCGKNTEVGKISNSRAYTSQVYDLIAQGLRTKEGVTINIHY